MSKIPFFKSTVCFSRSMGHSKVKVRLMYDNINGMEKGFIV